MEAQGYYSSMPTAQETAPTPVRKVCCVPCEYYGKAVAEVPADDVVEVEVRDGSSVDELRAALASQLKPTSTGMLWWHRTLKASPKNVHFFTKREVSRETTDSDGAIHVSVNGQEGDEEDLVVVTQVDPALTSATLFYTAEKTYGDDDADLCCCCCDLCCACCDICCCCCDDKKKKSGGGKTTNNFYFGDKDKNKDDDDKDGDDNDNDNDTPSEATESAASNDS